MTTDQLRLFLTIVRHRSLSRAAADLELGRATVSERLKALEAEVGAAWRSPRRARRFGLMPSASNIVLRWPNSRANKCWYYIGGLGSQAFLERVRIAGEGSRYVA